MEIYNINEKEPVRLLNVLVCHTIFSQDFWTRGYLVGDEWHVMIWGGISIVPMKDIKYWTYLPEMK